MVRLCLSLSYPFAQCVGVTQVTTNLDFNPRELFCMQLQTRCASGRRGSRTPCHHLEPEPLFLVLTLAFALLASVVSSQPPHSLACSSILLPSPQRNNAPAPHLSFTRAPLVIISYQKQFLSSFLYQNIQILSCQTLLIDFFFIWQKRSVQTRTTCLVSGLLPKDLGALLSNSRPGLTKFV